jgi:hypothetical protein
VTTTSGQHSPASPDAKRQTFATRIRALTPFPAPRNSDTGAPGGRKTGPGGQGRSLWPKYLFVFFVKNTWVRPFTTSLGGCEGILVLCRIVIPQSRCWRISEQRTTSRHER